MPLLTFQEERAGGEAGMCVCVCVWCGGCYVCIMYCVCKCVMGCFVLSVLCVCVETRGSILHTLLPSAFPVKSEASSCEEEEEGGKQVGEWGMLEGAPRRG